MQEKNNHKTAFREIFNLKAKDGQIDKNGLKELFQMIDYDLSEEQFNEMVVKIFNKKEQIVFDEFMKLFNLKLVDYTLNDVKNAFKLLAKDDDQYIPIEKIKKILGKNGLQESEIDFLLHQLDPFIEGTKGVNYQDFIQSLSG